MSWRQPIRNRTLEELLPRLRQLHGSDRTGAVSCMVDDAGRLQRVSVSSLWPQRVGVDGLGPAVLEALDFAASKAGLVPLVLRRHGVEHRPMASRVAWPETDRTTPPPGTPGFHEAIEVKQREAFRLLDAAANRIAGVDEETVAVSPSGIFRATRRGATVVRLAADRNIAPSADPDLIAFEARVLLAGSAA